MFKELKEFDEAGYFFINDVSPIEFYEKKRIIKDSLEGMNEEQLYSIYKKIIEIKMAKKGSGKVKGGKRGGGGHKK